MAKLSVLLVHSPDTRPLHDYVGTLISFLSDASEGFPGPELIGRGLGSSWPGRWDVLVRWGNTSGDDDAAAHVLNRRAQLLAAADHRTAQAILVGAGLRANLSARLPAVNTFRVHAFDQQLVFLGRRERERFGFQEVNPGASKLTQRIAQFGLRALYALGLDFGSVDIVINSAGALVVFAVNPSPSTEGRIGARYAEALGRYLDEAAEDAPISGVRLGADPEFMLRTVSGDMVPASFFFPQRGPIGCDAAVSPSSRGPVRPLAELRPEPSDSPLQLVQSLRNLLLRASRRVPFANLEFRAGSMPFHGHPIGGHIHFSGLPRVSGHLLRALDTYVGLPLFLVEDTDTARQRRPVYGYLGDFRPQPHGFEYRTPSSWLISPGFARAAFCLAKLVAVNYRQLATDVFATQGLIAAFYRADKEPFYPLIDGVFDDLSTLSGYAEYADQIEPLREVINRRGQWRESADIRQTWHLPKELGVWRG